MWWSESIGESIDKVESTLAGLNNDVSGVGGPRVDRSHSSRTRESISVSLEITEMAVYFMEL